MTAHPLLLLAALLTTDRPLSSDITRLVEPMVETESAMVLGSPARQFLNGRCVEGPLGYLMPDTDDVRWSHDRRYCDAQVYPLGQWVLGVTSSGVEIRDGYGRSERRTIWHDAIAGRFSPDGRQVALVVRSVGREDRLILTDLDGSTYRELYRAAWLTLPSFSPDSSRVLVVGGYKTPQLFVVHVDTKQVEVVRTPELAAPPIPVEVPVWLSGHQVVYEAERDMWSLDLKSGRAVRTRKLRREDNEPRLRGVDGLALQVVWPERGRMSVIDARTLAK